MELRSSLSRSTCWTCFRKLTKWLLSISCASGDSRGAHLLVNDFSVIREQPKTGAPLAIGNVPLHFVNINFTHRITILISVLIGSVHMNVHDVFCNHLPRIKKCATNGVKNDIPYLVVRCVRPSR